MFRYKNIKTDLPGRFVKCKLIFKNKITNLRTKISNGILIFKMKIRSIKIQHLAIEAEHRNNTFLGFESAPI